MLVTITFLVFNFPKTNISLVNLLRMRTPKKHSIPQGVTDDSKLCCWAYLFEYLTIIVITSKSQKCSNN